MGKPTGRREERVERDFDHEIPSIAIARKYMDEWGMSKADQRIVSLAIQYDGVVSDIARGKVRDDSKNMTPAQLRAAMKANERAIHVLRAVNRADVVATVGQGAYDRIAGSFERFFDQMNEVT